jgi:Ca-activated chloride channel homolog
MTFPKQDDDNPQIERMWAWHRVDRLLNVADAGGSRTAVLDEIVRLGEGYSIATEYTSFIVLENDAEYQRWRINRQNLLRTERDRAAQQKVAKQLEALRAKTTVALGPIDPDAAPKVDAPVRQVVDNRPQTSARPAPAPAPAQPNRNSRDFNLPRGGGRGGGAIDPVTGALALGLAAAAAVAQRRARGSRQDPRAAA